MKGSSNFSLQTMETNFNQLGEQMWAELTDLSISDSVLRGSFNKLMQLRTEIAKAHAGDWATPRTVKVAPALGTESSVDDWKALLCKAYGKELKIPPSKDQTLYNTTLADGGYEASCMCAWSGNTYSGELAASRKNAEHLAAKAALQAEFPAYLQVAMGQVGYTAGAKGGAHPMAGKRKHDAVDNNNSNVATDPKQILNQKMMIVKTMMGLDKLVSGDVKTESTPLDGGNFVSEVTITFLDTRNRHKGRPQESKKAAERSACEAALKALAGLINKYEVPFNERKRIKNAEALAKLKERTEAKNELNKASD